MKCPAYWYALRQQGEEQAMDRRGDSYLKARIRDIEAFRHADIGRERRLSKISTGAGGVVVGAMAVLVRVLGGG